MFRAGRFRVHPASQPSTPQAPDRAVTRCDATGSLTPVVPGGCAEVERTVSFRIFSPAAELVEVLPGGLAVAVVGGHQGDGLLEIVDRPR